MAVIDKTYVDNYEEYKKFKEWADKQVVTFFNGHKKNIGDWVWEYEKEDFSGREIPIMNTPTWMDIYLIQNCKSDFVLDRMYGVYTKATVERFLKVDLSKTPEGFEQNRKVRVKPIEGNTKYPLHNKPYVNKNKSKWWVQSYDNVLSYDDESKTWSDSEHYPTNTNTSADFKTIKALIRHLRKQYLPKGCEFRIIGRYIGEEYKITIH